MCEPPTVETCASYACGLPAIVVAIPGTPYYAVGGAIEPRGPPVSHERRPDHQAPPTARGRRALAEAERELMGGTTGRRSR
jgi:hypothetical protein